ncbi:hypothetical protein K9L67_02975 [Candidatus Woesearchaeota archaeon]|nr:hypothetical protein [Candidatus Woesearchaeota archaeon]MCF7901164.1 hypothetical protein [Candidatus Woesearchaeota archaeon]MCF8013822.1 hypothetical protein [Candidatus Woesearchaeota archaeon]
MKRNYKFMVSILFVILLLPGFVNAQFTVDSPGETGSSIFTGVIDIFSSVFKLISKFFSMDWLFNNPENVVGFMRFLIWLTVFTVIHVSGRNTVARMFEDGGNRLVVVLAVVIATLTTIFIPLEIILGWGQVVGAIMMLILIGVPIGYLMWLAYGPDILPAAFGADGWMIRIVRIILILIAWQISHLVGLWGTQLAFSMGKYTGSNQFVASFVLIGMILIMKNKFNKKLVEEKI